MEHHILHSEGFERGVSQLSHSIDEFRRTVTELTEAVRMFDRAVEKLKTVEGMKAENEKRADQGHAQAYGEDSFFNA